MAEGRMEGDSLFAWGRVGLWPGTGAGVDLGADEQPMVTRSAAARASELMRGEMGFEVGFGIVMASWAPFLSKGAG